MGLRQELKAYEMYDPVSKMIITSRDVIFEDKKWERICRFVRDGCVTLTWGDNDEMREGEVDERMKKIERHKWWWSVKK